MTTLRDQLVKIGAKIVRRGRSAAFQMAGFMISRALFHQILDAIASIAARATKRGGVLSGRLGCQQERSVPMSCGSGMVWPPVFVGRNVRTVGRRG